MDIMNAGDLKAFINEFLLENDNKSVCTLDEYLRSLLGLIYKYKDDKPSFKIFGQILKDSLSSQPLRYDSSWESYKEPPFLNCEPNPDDYENSLVNPYTKEVITKFEVLEKTLFFQIYDLKHINELMDSGVDLEEINNAEGEEDKLEDNSWRNFDVFNYLEASTYGLSDESETECDWLLFVDVLEYGRTYSLFDE